MCECVCVCVCVFVCVCVRACVLGVAHLKFRCTSKLKKVCMSVSVSVSMSVCGHKCDWEYV